MYVPKPHVLAQNPHTDVYAHLWSNMDDSSWIARDLAQTVHNLAGMHVVGQIGQVGINLTILIFGLLFVFVDGQYRQVEDDTWCVPDNSDI